jgi:hypothetical protein
MSNLVEDPQYFILHRFGLFGAIFFGKVDIAKITDKVLMEDD